MNLRLECKERRKALGVTQVQLATESGIPQGNISLFEAGKLDMRCTQVERLFNALERIEKRRGKREARESENRKQSRP